MNYESINKQLKERLSPKRFKHSQGVSETAAALAKLYGADVEKARIAGLLHDCARFIPNNTLLKMADSFGIVISDIEKAEPSLLHAPIGAKLAEKDFGIDDLVILRAIAFHTVGGPEMGLVESIVYLADFIEPGRDFSGVQKLRKLAKKSIDAALIAAYDQSIRYVIKQRGVIHPATVEGRNSLLLKQAKKI